MAKKKKNSEAESCIEEMIRKVYPVTAEQLNNKVIVMLLRDQAETLESLIKRDGVDAEMITTLAALYEVIRYNTYSGMDDFNAKYF